MTNLTKQWKKGELPCGWYWCDVYAEETKILYYDGDCFELDDPETKNYYFFSKEDCAEIEILEKVPSFEEHQKLLSDQLAKNEGVEINAELEAENTKLKELLKRCYSFIDWCELGVPVAQRPILMKDINQALGEE